jgi:hypothetical protein
VCEVKLSDLQVVLSSNCAAKLSHLHSKHRAYGAST